MAFCNQCGAQLQDGATFCPACGAQQGVAPQAAPQAAPQEQPQQQPAGGSFMDQIQNTPDYTATMDPADIEANKGLSILAYLGILFLVPLFAAPQSKFAKFHANQGLILCIIGVVLMIFTWIPIICYFAYLLDLVLFAYMIIGILNVVNGKAKELPFIGKIRILK